MPRGVPKEENADWSILAAYLALHPKYFQIESSNTDENGKEIFIDYECFEAKKRMSPEDKLILKETFEKLSSESREILFILTSMPQTLFDSLFTKKRKIFSAKRFLAYLKSRNFEVESILLELKEFIDLYFEIKG